MGTNNLYIKLNIEKLDGVLVAIMLITFQCYYILPWKIVFLLKTVFPLLVLILSIKRNNYKLKNIPYLKWGFIFYLVCLLSVLLSIDYKKSFNILITLTTTLLLLISISQYVVNDKQVKDVIKYLVIGGICYGGYIVLRQGLSSVMLNSIDTKYTNGTITQFTYITLTTTFCLIWKFIFENRFKLFNLIALLFCFVLNFASGRRKAVILPIIFLGILVFMKENKYYKKLMKIIVFLLAIYIFYVISMRNEVLYEIYGYRIDNLLTMTLGVGSGRVDGSLVARNSLVEIGINAFISNPIMGIGIGNFTSLNEWGYYAHNNYIELLATTGIIGIFVFYSIYIYIIFNSYKLRKVMNKDMFILIIAMTIILLINDFGVITYYRPYFLILMTLNTAIIDINKKRVFNLKEKSK